MMFMFVHELVHKHNHLHEMSLILVQTHELNSTEIHLIHCNVERTNEHKTR